jgi:hypothetical protein
MSASDLARSAGPTVAEILAKLGTGPKTGLNTVEASFARENRIAKNG